MTESEFQQQVKDLAQLCGWHYTHFHDSRRQVSDGKVVGDEDAKGFPDTVLVRPPQIIFAELKTEKGNPTREQDDYLNLLNHVADYWSHVDDPNWPVRAFLWRPSDWDAIMEVLR